MKLLYDIYMKKFKNFMRRIGKYTMAIIGCLTFLLCAGLYGCGIDAPEGEEYTAYNLYGTRVLYRPNNYSYDEAVGELGNARYYSILSKEILSNLYYIYGSYVENPNTRAILYGTDSLTQVEAEGIPKMDATNFNSTGAKIQYYYDNIRYQILSVDENLTSYNSNGSNVSFDATQILKADTSKGWNWSVGYNYAGDLTGESPKPCVTIFENVVANNNILQSTYNGVYYQKRGTNEGIYQNDWISKINKTNINYSEQFAGVEANSLNDHNKHYTGGYVDLLEYSIYKLVLGYTAEEIEDGIRISYDSTTGLPQITAEDKPITEALEDVRKMFEKLGSYVGITRDENVVEGEVSDVQKITDFILDVVIGQQSQVNVKLKTTYPSSSGISPKEETVTLNRDYENVVKNIVTYASTLSYIGAEDKYDEEENFIGRDFVTVDDAYMAAAVKFYRGDDFLIVPSDEDCFRDVPRNEYQSVCFMFGSEGMTISDIFLCFQYYAPDGVSKEEGKYADYLDINVNFRYYNAATDTLITLPLSGDNSSGKVRVKYGNLNDNAEDFYTMFTFAEEFTLNSIFDLDILTSDEFDGQEILINGTTKVKDYYHLNKSQTYGYYGSLNEEYIENDYFEICFDIDKVPGDMNTNYNFQVGFGYLGVAV